MKAKGTSTFLSTTVVILMGCMFFLTTLLCIEYCFFREQARKLLELQRDYQEYIVVLKQKTHQNKKMDGHEELSEAQAAHDEFVCEDAQSNCFTIVNREALYLRDGAVDFSKLHNLEKVIRPLYEHDAWDHTCIPTVTSGLNQSKRMYRNQTKNRKKSLKFYSSDFFLAWPIDKRQFWISSKFGRRKEGYHYGIDMAALKGTPVYAALEGVVIEASYAPQGYGKSIVIDHKKCKTRYAHLNDMYVKVGQKVDRSKPIGRVGDTGLVRGKNDASHLHFEVIDLFGKRINPLYILK